MRIISCFVFLLVFNNISAQNSFSVWSKLGVEKKLTNKLKTEIQFNARFTDLNAQTIFPQVGFEYKVKKWFKPSIEYRYIINRNKIGNYHGSSRLNFNLSLNKKINRSKLKVRLRYQMGFQPNAISEYNEDFDQAIRAKMAVNHDIKRFFLNPFVSSEIFFNPAYGPDSPGFSKIRCATGFKLDTKTKHSATIKYQIDFRLNRYNTSLRHVIALSYFYSF